MLYKLSYKLKRWRQHERSRGSSVQALYDQPPLDKSARFMDSRFLVLDCEMSGLDVRSNHLLSIGWVVIEHGRIVNASARHMLIHAEQGAGDSSKIHGLHDSSLAGANSVAAVLMLLMKQMPGTVLVMHHAGLDIRFLQKAAIDSFRCPMLFSYTDTMALEKRRLKLQGKPAGLRLAQCRERYGLSAGNQHNALADAMATAELLLAQVSYMGHTTDVTLSDLDLAVAS